MIYIYGLHCPRADCIRYVGKSTNPQKRLAAHLRFARTGYYNHNQARWLRSLQDRGLMPRLVILHELPEDADWQSVERAEIASASARGWRLTNTKAGGDGLSFRNSAERANVVKKMSAVAVSRCQTPEARRALSLRADRKSVV